MFARAELEPACMVYQVKYEFSMVDMAGNVCNHAAHFYDVYETSDGKYISIGAIEPQFYALLLSKLELDKEALVLPSSGGEVSRRLFRRRASGNSTSSAGAEARAHADLDL